MIHDPVATMAYPHFQTFSPLQNGHLIRDRYEIQEQIGQGGFGAVYRARDLELHIDVALKQTLLPPDAGRQQLYDRALTREARILAQLQHPHLPSIQAFFEVESLGLFMVMRFIDGHDLAALLQQRQVNEKGPFPFSDVLVWTEVVLQVLDYLHTFQRPAFPQNPGSILHLDLKPANLKLTQGGTLMVLDFGIARSGSLQVSVETGLEPVRGSTPRYAPLEQAMPGQEPSPQSDLYALAACMYTLLTNTGQPPSAVERHQAILQGRPDPVQALHLADSKIPTWYSELIRQAMTLHANGRPASAREMLDTIERHTNRPTVVLGGSSINQSDSVPLGPDVPRSTFGKKLVAMGLVLGAVGWPLYAGFQSWSAECEAGVPASFLGVWPCPVRENLVEASVDTSRIVLEDSLAGRKEQTDSTMLDIHTSRTLVNPVPEASKTMTELRQEARAAYDTRRYDEARPVLETLVERNDREAMFMLGYMYHQGLGLEADLDTAFELYQKAAEGGQADAQYALGLMYTNGTRGGIDDTEAERWFRAAANQGHKPAITALEALGVD